MTDLWRLDATAQAALVRSGEVSARELVEAALARIEALNPAVNAVVTPLFEEARGALDRLPDGPFRGVPMLLKDACQQLTGTPYYLGTQALKSIDWRSDRTTELTRRFLAAGFVVVGKAAVSELSAGNTTEPPAFGPTRNPWALDRSVSGSSGGSAAAVAVGMVPIAHGADGSGSLRYPAAACGVVTLKPSRGLIPVETPTPTSYADPWQEGVIARSVRDVAAAFDVTADRPRRFTAGLARPPHRLRVGLLRHDPFTPLPLHEECLAAVDAAGRLLEGLGHHVELAHPPALDGLLDDVRRSVGALAVSGRAEQVQWIEGILGRPLRPGDLSPHLLAEAALGARIGPDAVRAARVDLEGAFDGVLEWWREGWEVLVTPALRQPPWPLGDPASTGEVSGAFPFAFSMTGQPAMSLPLHWTPDGLPVGVQVVAAPGADGLLLRLAAALEEASGWRDRWPPLARGAAG